MYLPQRSGGEARERKVGLRRKLFNELVYGGHMPALDTSALTFTTTLLLGFTPRADLLLAAYLFTFGSYTLNRKREFQQDIISSPERALYALNRSRYADMIILICYMGSLLIAFLRSLMFFSALLIPLLLSYLYNIGSERFIPVLGVSRLKEKFLIKNTVVSMGWGLIAFLTLIYYAGSFTATVLAVFAFISIRVFINTVFCDIRDVEGDSAAKIQTIPIIIGVHRTKLLLILLNTLSGVFVFLSTVAGILPPLAHFLNLVTIYGYYYILRSFSPYADMKYLSDFVAESEELISIPLIIIGKVVLQG